MANININDTAQKAFDIVIKNGGVVI